VLRRLPQEQWRLLFTAIGCFWAFRLSLLLRPLATTRRLATWLAGHAVSPGWSVPAATRAARLAATLAPGSNHCLPQALTAWVLLNGCGTPATVRVGGRRRGRDFDAHAWVETEGAAVLGADSAFSPFTVLIPAHERHCRHRQP
jgi:hypothetical protein